VSGERVSEGLRRGGPGALWVLSSPTQPLGNARSPDRLEDVAVPGRSDSSGGAGPAGGDVSGTGGAGAPAPMVDRDSYRSSQSVVIVPQAGTPVSRLP
jgi:hypothetical protein